MKKISELGNRDFFQYIYFSPSCMRLITLLAFFILSVSTPAQIFQLNISATYRHLCLKDRRQTLNRDTQTHLEADWQSRTTIVYKNVAYIINGINLPPPPSYGPSPPKVGVFLSTNLTRTMSGEIWTCLFRTFRSRRPTLVHC